MGVSEVTQLRLQIAAEYMAAQWGLSGLASGTSRHAFITARMENMERNRQELAVLVGPQQAIALIAETLTSLPEQPERAYVQNVVTHLLGATEETEHFLAHIQAMWKTIDLLQKEFGEEGAHKIIHAPGITPSDIAVL